MAKPKTEAEFIRRGIAAIDATRRDGNGISADRVIAQLEAKLAAAALKIMAFGEKDRVQGKGMTAAQSRAQLLAARQNRK